MIIFPPEEIRKYITLDENGKWIHVESMPEELLPKFEQFKENVNAAEQYQQNLQ